MILEAFVTLIGVPAAGWVVKYQLDVNEQVAKNTAAIDALIKNSDHTVSRVDSIYDLLIAKAK